MDTASPKTWVITKVIITSSDGNILALRRSHTDPERPLTWDLPGGIVEYGEDPTEAAIRETVEETGQVIGQLRPMAVMSNENHRGYAILLVFLAEAQNDAVELSYEHDQYKWVSREQFLELDAPKSFKDAVRNVVY